MTREMTGAEMVIQALADQGVKHLFGYPGGAVLPIYDAIFEQDKVRHILVRHEQGAVHAAEGYARSTGKVGCVLVTSGPGATNAVTGLTDALMDSIPIVCITGQVPTHLIGNDAFQEADTVGITRPCTKHNYLVKRIEDLPRVLHEAFHIAVERPARPGGGRHPEGHPVRHRHLFQAEGEPAHRLQAQGQGRHGQDQAGGRTDGARQEAGVLHRRRRDQFRQGGERPVARAGQAHRLPDHLDADGARRLSRQPTSSGWACSACTARWKPTWRCTTATSWSASARASTTASPGGSMPSRPARRRSTSTSTRRRSTRTSTSTCRSSATARMSWKTWCGCGARRPSRPTRRRSTAWWQQIDKWRARKSLAYRPSNEVIKPQYAIQRLYELTKDRDTYITTEVGQHQMWAAQFYGFEEPNRWMTSGRARHHGLRPAGLGRRAARASGLAGHRYRRRGLACR